MLIVGCVIACFGPGTNAETDTEQEAEAAASRGDFSGAADIYERLLAQHPAAVALRLDFADALKDDRQWDRAVSEYKAVLIRQPNNAEAVLGLATLQRWQGSLAEARQSYAQAHKLVPQNASALLGLAETYVLDHDYIEAEKLYVQAEQLWPGDSAVQQAAHDFRRQRNPRLYLFWENDLSFEAQQAGVILPFAAREEIGAEYGSETSIAPQLENAEIYSRADKRVFYTHYFGRDHMLDFSARTSKYSYNMPDSALGYVAIGSYEEYRARYTMPLAPQQVLAVRYSARPTTLELTQDRFVAHKLEAELSSHWVPRVSTILGGGWLRELDSDASTASELTNRSLFKIGVHWDATNNLGLGAKYITNPDLDNSMTATAIAEASYTLSDAWSAIARYRADDYKNGFDQTSHYIAARFVPGGSWWSEIGLKHAERGSESGNFGLASVSYRF